MKKEVVPAESDCHLSANVYFSIERFQAEVYRED